MAAIFERNDRVRHPTFGLGTVMDVQRDGVVEVLFDVGGRKRLSLQYARLSLISLEEEVALLQESQRYIEETFAPADDPDAHGHARHLSVITEDVSMFISQVLPTALKESSVIRCWGDEHVPVVVLPPEEPRAVSVVWPTQYYGVMMLIRLNEKSDTYECISAYPWFSEGTSCTITVDKIHPWHSRVEGHVTGTLRGLTVTFFDALFARHKTHYVSGRLYRFILMGIAYSCEAVASTSLEITDPDVIRILTGKSDRDEGAQRALRIETGGLAAFYPIEGWDRNDYHFQGVVREISETDFLGQKTWQVRLTIGTSPDDGSDVDIDVYVTRRSLKSDRLPRKGDELRGTLWIQGYLICPDEGPDTSR